MIIMVVVSVVRIKVKVIASMIIVIFNFIFMIISYFTANKRIIGMVIFKINDTHCEKSCFFQFITRIY